VRRLRHGAAIEAAETTDVCGNGLDEDCDGEIDEGDQRGLECFEGIGACRRQGV
jgi:hypothetical protein